MVEVVLDANVIVAFLDANDSLHERANRLLQQVEAQGHDAVLLDVCVGEATSVLCSPHA